MDINTFWHSITVQNTYISPDEKCFFVRNLPGLSTLLYYIRILGIIRTESNAARRGVFDRHRWAESSLRILKMIESVGGRINISGLKEIENQQSPVVYVANHMSMIDTFILPSIVLKSGEATFVLKEGLLKYPFFGDILKAINPISVTRKNPREDMKVVLEKGYDLISNGYSIIIFPQTTRSALFDAAAFNSLGVKLAKKANVPVIPVALKTDFLSNGRFFKEIGSVVPSRTIFVKFGQPIPVEGNGHVAHRKVVEFIAENLVSWQGEVKNFPLTS
jgi:1-acyl-sn-glycerol-3-phosphate acyltransferase